MQHRHECLCYAPADWPISRTSPASERDAGLRFVVRNSYWRNNMTKLDGSERVTLPLVTSLSGTVPPKQTGHSIVTSTCAPTGTACSEAIRRPHRDMLIVWPS